MINIKSKDNYKVMVPLLEVNGKRTSGYVFLRKKTVDHIKELAQQKIAKE